MSFGQYEQRVDFGSHSVVRNELFFHRQSVLAKIKALPGCATIRGLVLRSG